MNEPTRIAVIGLGYVGLPLAVGLARHYDVVGYDVSAGRIAELQAGEDRTREVAPGDLAASRAIFSDDPAAMAGCDLYIVTVPTPVTAANEPDLGAVVGAAEAIGGQIAAGATVVLESTVYPGATEEVMGPALARVSGLAVGTDIRLGYSPERMNPGDKTHTLATLTKVVAGQDAETTAMLATVYGRVTNGNVHVAPTIRTAEAAKVIENAQRDINIAFINEVAMIFHRMGLSVYDVLEAARTKWNFLPFTPGLVGGHCIGVDPYYLAHRAQAMGHEPEVILAGRRINDGMGGFIAREVASRLSPGARILVLGLTFKENVPDLRNTRVVDIVAALRGMGHDVRVHDPLAAGDEAKTLYGIDLLGDLAAGDYDAVVGAVAHDVYRAFGADDFARLLAPKGLVADIKGMWRDAPMPDGVTRWEL